MSAFYRYMVETLYGPDDWKFFSRCNDWEAAVKDFEDASLDGRIAHLLEFDVNEGTLLRELDAEQVKVRAKKRGEQ